VRAETSASPEQVIEIAGKDFSPRRAEVWPNVRKTRLTEMILDRRFRSSGWGRIGYVLNRLGGERLFASMLRGVLKGVEKRESQSKQGS